LSTPLLTRKSKNQGRTCSRANAGSGCDFWIVTNILDKRRQFDRAICPQIRGIQGLTPFQAGGHTSCKIGPRIMQSSQSPTIDNAVASRLRGLAYRGTRGLGQRQLPVLPIEERIS
jgi:hypothetical protein